MLTHAKLTRRAKRDAKRMVGRSALTACCSGTCARPYSSALRDIPALPGQLPGIMPRPAGRPLHRHA